MDMHLGEKKNSALIGYCDIEPPLLVMSGTVFILTVESLSENYREQHEYS